MLSPRRQQTSALRIAAGRGYSDCARHLLLRGAEVDAVVGGRAPLHDCAAAPRPDCARLLLAFGADPNVLSAEGAAPLHLCTAPDSLAYAPPRGTPLICMYSHAPAPRPRPRQLCTGLSKGLSARQAPPTPYANRATPINLHNKTPPTPPTSSACQPHP